MHQPSAALVEFWLIAFWRADPRLRSPGGAAPISWCALYLPASHPMSGEARDFLMMWAKCRAERESWRDFCVRRGWSRSTADRWRRWAVGEIVRGLEADAAASAAT